MIHMHNRKYEAQIWIYVYNKIRVFFHFNLAGWQVRQISGQISKPSNKNKYKYFCHKKCLVYMGVINLSAI